MGTIGRQSGRAVGIQRLTNPVNISLSGDASGSVSFDGSQNVSVPLVLSSSQSFSGTLSANNLIVSTSASFPKNSTINSIVIADATNFFQKPNGTSSPLFSKVSAYQLSIPVGFKCIVNNTIVTVTSLVTLTLNSTGVSGLDTGTKTAGTDYYVYALDSGSFIISANVSYPFGYNASNSRKIGGFHYGLIPESFTAVNNITSTDATTIAGINAYSFWVSEV